MCYQFIRKMCVTSRIIRQREMNNWLSALIGLFYTTAIIRFVLTNNTFAFPEHSRLKSILLYTYDCILAVDLRVITNVIYAVIIWRPFIQVYSCLVSRNRVIMAILLFANNACCRCAICGNKLDLRLLRSDDFRATGRYFWHTWIISC